MKKILLTLLLASPLICAEQDNLDMHDHSHEGHLHDTMVDGKNLNVDPDRFDKFMEELTDVKIAIVSVKGMVCDFCARGIEKTFKRDPDLLKIDVDLNFGKVLMAYKPTAKINEKSIATTIRDNGQEVVKIDTLY